MHVHHVCFQIKCLPARTVVRSALVCTLFLLSTYTCEINKRENRRGALHVYHQTR